MHKKAYDCCVRVFVYGTSPMQSFLVSLLLFLIQFDFLDSTSNCGGVWALSGSIWFGLVLFFPLGASQSPLFFFKWTFVIGKGMTAFIVPVTFHFTFLSALNGRFFSFNWISLLKLGRKFRL